jgi:hypothetical protein
VRVMHHLLGLADVPFDVGAICPHQVHELGLGDKRRPPARRRGGTAGGQDAAQGGAEMASHGAFLR